MKIFIVFALIAIASAVSTADADVKEQDQRIAEHLKKCLVDFPITAEKLAELKDGKITKGTEEEQCFVNCFMENAGILVDGKLQKEKAIQAITVRSGAEKANEAVEKCQSDVGDSKCETALKLYNCFHGLGIY